ncbi:MAG: RanGTP-binding protein-domain-containing protein [Benjaminiella poitrasii]|nr:MAG: RanGTP-binding protein-domain-containing protein [Benjaminiella poitrasii]
MSSLEDLFGKIALTTVTTVSRIALSHATNAAIRNVTSYITTQLPKNKPDSKEIRTLQRHLDLKIKNLKPTIDIIARSVADGNSDLEPALEICNDLKSDLDDFATHTLTDADQVKSRLRQLIANVDDAIPSLHLALRSIENKSDGHDRLEPAKLVQASHVLAGHERVTFRVKLYSLFSANERAQATSFTWKEEFHKADLVVVAKKKGEESKRGYEMVLTMNQDDGLYHDEDEKTELVVNVGQIERLYYTQSGQLLNIEDAKSPVLVMKVRKQDETEKEGGEAEEDEQEKVKVKEAAPEIITEELRKVDWYAIGLWTSDEDDSESEDDTKKQEPLPEPFSLNLLLLEDIIKLALLEITEQINHIHASDELITLYMKNK